MQWIIGAVMALFVINIIAFVLQTIVYQMNGGAPITCDAGVPTLLCGTPAYPAPDFLEASQALRAANTDKKDKEEGLIRRILPTALTAAADAVDDLWDLASGYVGFIGPAVVVDYAVFNGDPSGEDTIAGWVAIVGLILRIIGLLSLGVIIVALAAPIIGRLPIIGG